MTLPFYILQPNFAGNPAGAEQGLPDCPTDIVLGELGLAASTAASVDGPCEIVFIPTVKMRLGFSTKDGGTAVSNAAASPFLLLANEKVTHRVNVNKQYFAWVAA